jgi:hypothetical protein
MAAISRMGSIDEGQWCDWCAKKSYASKAKADEAIAKYAETSKMALHRYRCRFGNGYHLTRRKPFDPA